MNVLSPVLKGGILTKHNWWEIDNMQGILLIFSQVIAGCLVWFTSDLWIVLSALYIVFGTLVYHCTVESKNRDIDYLRRSVEHLEKHTENLVKELQNIRSDSQCSQSELPLRKG